MVLGGGVLAGSVGLLCFYAAIKGAPLSQVMPIAFTAPLFGAMMGLAFGGERFSWKLALGMALTVSGIIVLTMDRP
jgi:transporter family protein